jgi:hypothetical protein
MELRRPLPYTDYQGLVHYLRVNHVQYLFLESWQIEGYPFLASFSQRSPRDFVLLDRVNDTKGRETELYRLETAAAGTGLSQNPEPVAFVHEATHPPGSLVPPFSIVVPAFFEESSLPQLHGIWSQYLTPTMSHGN